MVSILFHSFFLQFAKVTGAEYTCVEAEENTATQKADPLPDKSDCL